MRKIGLNSNGNYERAGYHKGIGKEPCLGFDASAAGGGGGKRSGKNIKGETVRQALAAVVRRSSFGARFLFTAVVVTAAIATTAPQALANSLYAAIVVDAKTGKVLHESSADSRRYPASLTKMMTIYLTFEAMASGKIGKNTKVPISKNAAAEPPTKIGLKPGATITVDNAIKALVTKSANDISTALAEFLGGSESNFARLMTAKARALGMKSTVFRNAHGLPNTGQYTTARDMALLGIALREHFPRYYDYFSTRTVTIAGRQIRGHNNLLGRIKGVDGIKTGYIRASGFNLVTSIQVDGKSVVGVVMGGKTARSRDDQMAALLRKYLPRASTRGGGGLIAARKVIEPTEVATASAADFVLPRRNAPTPDLRPVESAEAAYAEPVQAPAAAVAVAALEAGPVPVARPERPVGDAEIGEGDIDTVETSSTSAISGWVIQVASTGSEAQARDVLAATVAKAPGILSEAIPFTEPFAKDGVQYHRARFAGFSSKDAAWSACDGLKRRKVSCYAVMQ